MLGPKLLLTTAFVGAIASASYLPPTAQEPSFSRHLRRQSNGTAFHGPYSTQGRDIVDSRGETITWAGVNWPMSGRLTLSAPAEAG
jgi:endoglucanase